jgi:hypothetical protein
MPHTGNHRLGTLPTAATPAARPPTRSPRSPTTGGVHDDSNGAIAGSPLWPLVVVLGDIAARVCRRQAEEQTGGNGIAAADDAAA